VVLKKFKCKKKCRRYHQGSRKMIEGKEGSKKRGILLSPSAIMEN
jgi:hypothetical protein